MLQIIVPITPEGWDDEKQEFVEPIKVSLQLEHSLVSLADWESKWCKPFLQDKEMTDEETLDYIKLMTLTKNVDPDVYNHLTHDNYKSIRNYIAAPMTATTFSENRGGKHSRQIITAELIYHWMIALNIPFDPCETWHLNRLLTLVRVCNIKNQPPKKRSRRETASNYAALNAARRKQYHSKG